MSTKEKDLLTLEELKRAAAVGLFVANGYQVVSDREVLNPDPDFVIINCFYFDVEDIPNDIVNHETRLFGDRLHEGHGYIVYCRIRVKLDGDMRVLLSGCYHTALTRKTSVLSIARHPQEGQKGEK
jgi:hypothetical protein